MDKDRVKGAKNQASGSVKEAVGKVTGDKTTEAEGKAQKVGARFSVKRARRKMLSAKL